ncbi:hypothetical protein SCHPADRAFT_889529 [Schizopora paradoxa]|uniref:Uncharacterized protein n=1 Tax=Schizopora paradoxa TaxID=27342 RepID=A0A0H2RR32_9AGAM|nr:hypothetical protein SCHPADRAFT_889529 [Schizopora paradoxa]
MNQNPSSTRVFPPIELGYRLLTNYIQTGTPKIVPIVALFLSEHMYKMAFIYSNGQSLVEVGAMASDCREGPIEIFEGTSIPPIPIFETTKGNSSSRIAHFFDFDSMTGDPNPLEIGIDVSHMERSGSVERLRKRKSLFILKGMDTRKSFVEFIDIHLLSSPNFEGTYIVLFPCSTGTRELFPNLKLPTRLSLMSIIDSVVQGRAGLKSPGQGLDAPSQGFAKSHARARALLRAIQGRARAIEGSR